MKALLALILLFLWLPTWALGAPGTRRAEEGGRLRTACDEALQGVLATGPWSERDSVDFDWLLPVLPRLSDSATVEAEAMQMRPRGTCTVALRLLEQGRVQRRLTIPVRVRRWDLLPVARRELPRGRILSAEDLEERWLESTQWADGDLIPLAEALGCRVSRYLLAGRPLPRRMLESVPDVLRGENLTLTVRSGGVAVSAAAEALEDGRIGQTLQLRLTETGRRMNARLTSKGQAEVEVAG
jgi:flagella basal body P-ring formation protein FlgA